MRRQARQGQPFLFPRLFWTLKTPRIKWVGCCHGATSRGATPATNCRFYLAQAIENKCIIRHTEKSSLSPSPPFRDRLGHSGMLAGSVPHRVAPQDGRIISPRRRAAFAIAGRRRRSCRRYALTAQHPLKGQCRAASGPPAGPSGGRSSSSATSPGIT